MIAGDHNTILLLNLVITHQMDKNLMRQVVTTHKAIYLQPCLNLSLNFGYFHFSEGSSTSLTACWLSIFMLSQPRWTVLWVDRSGPQFQSSTGSLEKNFQKQC